MSKIIKVKYIDETLPKLEYIGGKKSNCIDLYSRIDVKLKQGETSLIPLNVVIKVPRGYYSRVLPRSSTYKKYNIIQTNSIGIIDNTYCGVTNDKYDELQMPIRCMEKLGCDIHKGDRIAQLELVKIHDTFKLKTIKKIKNKARGGFGSTNEK